MQDALIVACGLQFPDQGLNLGPLDWEHRVLTTAPPGKSQTFLFKTSLQKNLKHIKSRENKSNEVNVLTAYFKLLTAW